MFSKIQAVRFQVQVVTDGNGGFQTIRYIKNLCIISTEYRKGPENFDF
jgi:hypothetical protein